MILDFIFICPLFLTAFIIFVDCLLFDKRRGMLVNNILLLL